MQTEKWIKIKYSSLFSFQNMNFAQILHFWNCKKVDIYVMNNFATYFNIFNRNP